MLDSAKRKAAASQTIWQNSATLAKHKMETLLKAGEGKSVFKDYIIATNNYLVPFFGSYNITNIDYALIKEFGTWRKVKMGHEPKSVPSHA